MLEEAHGGREARLFQALDAAVMECGSFHIPQVFIYSAATKYWSVLRRVSMEVVLRGGQCQEQQN